MFDESENEKKKAVNKYEIFERKTFNGKLFVGKWVYNSPQKGFYHFYIYFLFQ